ncbi:helix-hairpin-helix domain-containing protein [Streptomyces sp. NPDC085460]|uniref:DNA polymerase Y family protein n=1 Tax=Streptomyces sp. NPDC085460 TaxID=3365723 RepID=UPI0037D987ED
MNTPTAAPTSTPAPRRRAIARIRFHITREQQTAELYEQLLGVIEGISPRVEALPADWSAYVDLAGALRYWDRDIDGLLALIRLRLLALYGVTSSAGAGPTRSLAAMAAALTPPGAVTTVHDTPYEIAAFLRPRRVGELPGIGPKTAQTLTRYGISTVGDIADTPPATLQRILGTTAARQAQALAHGTDHRPVVPAAPAKSLSAGHRFDHDELDTDRHQRTVLALVEDLGTRLRSTGEITEALTLTVTYTDRTQTTRTRTLPEATAHTPTLTTTARDLLHALGLQRARVRALSLRAERLRSDDSAVHQLTFDDRDEKLHRLEAALDRARARYGSSIAGAASAHRHPSKPHSADTDAGLRARGTPERATERSTQANVGRVACGTTPSVRSTA